MISKINSVMKDFLKVFFIVSIIILAFSLTPKTFQNDTFYTIKIGEFIENTTEKKSDLLPWNKGLDMRDHYSYHNLPYTYPHWLYDLITYKVYQINGFVSVYVLTCVLSVIMGLAIYFINVKLNKNHILSYLVTVCSLICLKSFIAARAQLVTFILFALTIFNIEMFIKKKNPFYAVVLVLISLLIANLHCAVWPFYFVLYLPYLASYIITNAICFDYKNHIKMLNVRLRKSKFSKEQYGKVKAELKKKIIEHKLYMERALTKTNKLEIVQNKNIKYVFIIVIICAFMGLITPIKDTPYTYLIKTMEGNTTESICEHQPLVLIENKEMIGALIILFGILVFAKAKVRLCDFFMIMGLVALSFISQRQVSMFVLIGNFILTRLLYSISCNMKDFIKVHMGKNFEEAVLIRNLFVTYIAFSICLFSYSKYIEKKSDKYIDETSYPVAAAKYINDKIIPSVGKDNIRLYNEYNYGSYLLFDNIPVFIDSRADLYAPEFNGKKDEQGKYEGNDIFSDFIGIDNLSEDYESKFDEYKITHVITYRNSKLASLLEKDINYSSIYGDKYFKIYERECCYE